MTKDPASFMFSNQHSCCTEHFDYDYYTCIGTNFRDCATNYFYPDWRGANQGCIDDGNEAAYMRQNSMEYLFSALADCCKKHFNWNYMECIGGQPGAYGSLFYPDFEGSNEVCLTGGDQPKYMNNAPEVWMKTSLEDCCVTYYGWVKQSCMEKGGASSGTVTTGGVSTATGTSKWYVIHQDKLCVQDCAKGSGTSCGGRAMPSSDLHDTAKICCAEKLGWMNPDFCLSRAVFGSETYTDGWVTDYANNKCVKDCDPAVGSPCANPKHDNESATIYATAKQCCESSLGWLDTGSCTTKSEE